MKSLKVGIEDLEESNKKNKKLERKNETCRKRTEKTKTNKNSNEEL